MAEARDSVWGCLGALGIAAWVGYSMYSKYEIRERPKPEVAQTDTRASVASAAARESQAAKLLKEATEREHQNQARAIQLAKSAYTLKGRLRLQKPEVELMTNEYQIRRHLSGLTGEVNVIGWQAVPG